MHVSKRSIMASNECKLSQIPIKWCLQAVNSVLQSYCFFPINQLKTCLYYFFSLPGLKTPVISTSPIQNFSTTRTARIYIKSILQPYFTPELFLFTCNSLQQPSPAAFPDHSPTCNFHLTSRIPHFPGSLLSHHFIPFFFLCQLLFFIFQLLTVGKAGSSHTHYFMVTASDSKAFVI